MSELPDPVARLCARLGHIEGVEAVTIGGSRATGTADDSSDWDIGVYYRGAVDLSVLARYGEVHPPGSWGRIMNGGAWLSLEGTKVDVLLRDLDVALSWTDQARLGVYELDALLGYLAGAPTYSLMAELALSRTVNGRLPAVGEYPDALAGRRPPLATARRLQSHPRTDAGRARRRRRHPRASRQGRHRDGARSGLPSPAVGAEREEARGADRASGLARQVRRRSRFHTRARRLGGRASRDYRPGVAVRASTTAVRCASGTSSGSTQPGATMSPTPSV